MGMDKVFNRVRNLDAYPKVNEDFYSRTLSGGVITLVSSVVILLLFFSELGLFSLDFYVRMLASSPNLGFCFRLVLWDILSQLNGLCTLSISVPLQI